MLVILLHCVEIVIYQRAAESPGVSDYQHGDEK